MVCGWQTDISMWLTNICRSNIRIRMAYRTALSSPLGVQLHQVINVCEQHWVCGSSIRCPENVVEVYDSIPAYSTGSTILLRSKLPWSYGQRAPVLYCSLWRYRDRVGVVTVHSLQSQMLSHCTMGSILTWWGTIKPRCENTSATAAFQAQQKLNFSRLPHSIVARWFSAIPAKNGSAMIAIQIFQRHFG